MSLKSVIFGTNKRGVKIPISSNEITFAQLDPSPYVGQMANLSDPNSVIWGASVTASGASGRALVRWNGSAWTVVGK